MGHTHVHVAGDFNSNKTIRDAIDLANTTAGEQQIWLPAWDFVLTRERIQDSDDVETDVGEGDLEVKQTLTLRGITDLTKVHWRSGTAFERVFELLGDYNFDGIVDTADYISWSIRLGQSGPNNAADGDDNGIVDNADKDVRDAHFGYSLALINVA